MSEKVIDGDRPSSHGATLGKLLAMLADVGERDSPVPMERCLTCAFREGSAPNQTAGTGVVALNCVLGIDKDRFACHHGMKEGEPKRLCSGYIMACLAPFSFVKDALAAFYADLDKEGGGPDPIREAFDAWLTEVDPDGKMDVYQAARAWAKRDAPAPHNPPG